MFWKKFERICNERGESPNGVAKKLNISSGSVTWWKKGKIPHNATLKRLADYFGISVGYFTGNDETPIPVQRSAFDIFSIEGIQPIGKTKKLPILGNIACGEPVWAEQEFNGYIEVEDGIKADFCLRAKGDSMIGARIFDGDIVFVRRQPTVENGEIAVVLIDNEATLKRVKLYPDKQKLVLHPENSAYEPLVFIGEELSEIKILGKAVAFQSLVR